MYKYFILIITLFTGSVVRADQLDGLAFLTVLIPAVIVGGISFLVMLVSAMVRFSANSTPKAVRMLNISGVVLILSALVCIFSIGFTNIDPGFLATCIGMIVIAGILLFLSKWRDIKR